WTAGWGSTARVAGRSVTQITLSNRSSYCGMKIIFISVCAAARTNAPTHHRRASHPSDPTEWRLQLMENNKVFSPIADQGQLAHHHATHAIAVGDNPFRDAVEADPAGEK